MARHISKTYTRSGDDGTTSLSDGQRIDKDDLRLEVSGDIEELNATIGIIATSQNIPNILKQFLSGIQHDLLELSHEISSPKHHLITQKHVISLENIIDTVNAELPMMKEFSLPSGSPGTATSYFARAVCRRLERHMVSLNKERPLNPYSLSYINRLGDLLQTFAKLLLRTSSHRQRLWKKNT